MVLSKRERYIAAAALACLALLMLDRFLLAPLAGRKAAVEKETTAILSELERARSLFESKKELAPRWREMLDAGLAGTPAELESRVLHAVRNWSEESRLDLSSVRPERTTERGKMQELTFQASGTGQMSAVAGFLWRLETSQLPVRLTDMQLGARREGADEVSLQIRISALCLPREEKAVVAAEGGLVSMSSGGKAEGETSGLADATTPAASSVGSGPGLSGEEGGDLE